MIKLTISVLLGGLETTASTLGFIMRHLASTPELRAELVQNSSLIPSAVEELLRRFAPIMLGRIAAFGRETHHPDVRRRHQQR